MNAAFDALLWQHTWQVSVLLGLTFLMRALLKKRVSNELLAWLWLIPILRLFLPLMPQTPMSVFNLETVVQSAFANEGRPQYQAPSWDPTTVPDPIVIVPMLPAPAVAEVKAIPDKLSLPKAKEATSMVATDARPLAVSEIESEPEMVAVLPSRIAINWVFGLWLAGVILGVGLTLWRYRGLCQVLRRLRPLEDPSVVQTLEQVRDQLGVRPVRWCVSSDVHGPTIIGWWRPRLVVPETLVPFLDAADWQHIGYHELAHLKRWDPIIGMMLDLGAVLHWFNPLVWLARRSMHADRELASDDYAIRHLPAGRTAPYGLTLLKVVQQIPKPHHGVAMARSQSEVSRRVRALCAAKPHHAWQGSLFWTAALLLLLVGATDKRATAQQEPVQARPSRVALTTTTEDPLILELEKQITARVKETLTKATKRPEIEEPFTWTSQPGMIRRFASSKVFTTAFALYSGSQEEFTSAEDLESTLEALVDWQESPNQFVDLNEPMGDGVGKIFPILDPRAASAYHVEGFGYDKDAMPGTEDEKSLPMPVSWLYATKDGSLASIEKLKSSEDNPIVARVAYWADDESCKINVNTASEGIPWDVPKVDTDEDRDYAKVQPGLTEYQRHPGHPATTCLSVVLFPDRALHAAEADKRLTNEDLKRIYAQSPRVVFYPRLEVTADKPTHRLPSDDLPLYDSVDEYLDNTQDYAKGFLTTASEAPEQNVHGEPRVSLWPNKRSGSDSPFESARTMATLRELAVSARKPLPGYGSSLVDKVDQDLPASLDQHSNHMQILTSMVDYRRLVNLHGKDEPFASDLKKGYGQVTGLSLSKETGEDAVEAYVKQWAEKTIEPKGAGRMYTLSEAALVFYDTAQVDLEGWTDDGPEFGNVAGGSGDGRVMNQILSNEHPDYERHKGRKFGPEDVGHTFSYIEVGMIPEVFCVAHGHDPMVPIQSMRLLNGSSSKGVHETTGLKINGVPLMLWGQSMEAPGKPEGPALMSIDSKRPERALSDLPAGWYPWGGSGGPRLMRFGTFTFNEDSPGWKGSNFLPNGTGPLSHFYCQTTVILRDDEDLTLTQEDPMELVVYDAVGEEASLENAIQQFRLRWAKPGESVVLPKPQRAASMYAGWTRRFRMAATANMRKRHVSILDPALRETVLGLSVTHGDYRHAAMKRQVPSELLGHHPLLSPQSKLKASIEAGPEGSRVAIAHSLTWSGPTGAEITPGATYAATSLAAGAEYPPGLRPDYLGEASDRQRFAPLLDTEYRFPIDPTITRDFDNGIAGAPDGAYINKPDEGAPVEGPFDVPYFDVPGKVSARAHLEIPPLRQIASAVAFGSLPSALQANAPWTTLLFRPNIARDPVVHPHLGEPGNGLRYLGQRKTSDGFSIPRYGSVRNDRTLPPDHLWLDLFTMPVPEPKHVSKSLATMGKINMNYQMMPFRHIRRATGLHAVFKSERLLCIPTKAALVYKTETTPTFRHAIDAGETLKQFDAKFTKGEVFLTESEICEQFLIPEGLTWDEGGQTMRKFWDAHRLTGDNSLERPYHNLYPRLTTRSNVFRVHLRIQLLKPMAQLDEDGADVQTDFRGSQLVHRDA